MTDPYSEALVRLIGLVRNALALRIGPAESDVYVVLLLLCAWRMRHVAARRSGCSNQLRVLLGRQRDAGLTGPHRPPTWWRPSRRPSRRSLTKSSTRSSRMRKLEMVRAVKGRLLVAMQPLPLWIPLSNALCGYAHKACGSRCRTLSSGRCGRRIPGGGVVGWACPGRGHLDRTGG